MPKLFNTIPVGAINAVVNVIGVIKSLLIHGLTEIATLVVGQLSAGVNTASSAA